MCIKKLITNGLNKIEQEQMKSSNINTRNTEKDIIVDLNVHFFLSCKVQINFIIILIANIN